MKLTLNPSPSHVYNLENSVFNHSPRNISGLKPHEMPKLQMTYGDNDMKIMIKKEEKLLKKAQSLSESPELKIVKEENEEEIKEKNSQLHQNITNKELLHHL